MGIYLNPNNTDFYNAVNYSQIYVDKTDLINYTNKVLFGEQKFICVSRPRRFGKSMAANMLTAYYSRGCDSKEMFGGLKIANTDSFEKHLNKYNVIHINMVNYFGESKDMDEMIKFIEEDLIDELQNDYPDIKYPKRLNLIKIIAAIFSQTNIPFIFIIDEWDCIFRIHKNNEDTQETI